MSKSATNRKWTSTKKYRDNWDRIFAKKPASKNPGVEKLIKGKNEND